MQLPDLNADREGQMSVQFNYGKPALILRGQPISTPLEKRSRHVCSCIPTAMDCRRLVCVLVLCALQVSVLAVQDEARLCDIQFAHVFFCQQCVDLDYFRLWYRQEPSAFVEVEARAQARLPPLYMEGSYC